MRRLALTRCRRNHPAIAVARWSGDR